jgi:K+-transporting ATPase KdpF subunit
VTGIESVVGLALSALVTAYLVYALLFPEKL